MDSENPTGFSVVFCSYVKTTKINRMIFLLWFMVSLDFILMIVTSIKSACNKTPQQRCIFLSVIGILSTFGQTLALLNERYTCDAEASTLSGYSSLINVAGLNCFAAFKPLHLIAITFVFFWNAAIFHVSLNQYLWTYVHLAHNESCQWHLSQSYYGLCYFMF